jgi:hypothetical protein
VSLRLYFSCRIFSYNSRTLWLLNGRHPYIRAYRVTPIAQMSAALPLTAAVPTCDSSGDANAGDPLDDFKRSSSFVNISETPKSTIFRTSLESRRRLSGLISRWTIPCAWTRLAKSNVAYDIRSREGGHGRDFVLVLGYMDVLSCPIRYPSPVHVYSTQSLPLTTSTGRTHIQPITLGIIEDFN